MRSLGKAIANLVAKKGEMPVPYARDGVGSGRLFGGGTRDRETQIRSIEHNGLLFSIVNRTSTALASVQWHLYRQTPNRDVTTDRVEVFNHAALDLLRKPNTFMSRYQLFESVQQHIDLSGEGYVVLAKSKLLGIPLEMWPVIPNRIEPVPSSTKFLAGWLYTGPNGEQIPLENDEVIQIRMPHPRDPYRGLGPVQSMLTELDSYRYSTEWNRNFFLNSARPDGIIKVPKNLGDGEWEKLVLRWNEQHKGVQRAHRVAVLEEADWIPNQMSLVDMQFVELQTQSRDRLLEAFGLSGSMIGVVEDVNRANAESAKAMFAEYLTVPRAERWKDQLFARLLPMYGETASGLEFDYDSPVPADVELDNSTRTSKSMAALNLVNAGYDPDDVLDAVDLPKMKYVGKPASATPPAFDPTQPVAPDNPVPVPPSNLRLVHKISPHVHNDDGEDDIDTSDIDLTTVDEQWQSAVQRTAGDYVNTVVPIQRKDLLGQITAHVDAGKIAALAALSVDSDDGAALLLDAMTMMAGQAGDQVVVEAMKQGVDGVQPHMPKTKPMSTMADVTAGLLARELAVSAGRQAMRVYHDGMTGQQVADIVEAFLVGLSDANARMQLGGALSAAQNQARLATYVGTAQDGGPIASLYAVEILDRNTCAPCREIDGRFVGNAVDDQTTDEVNSLYPNGGYVNCAGGSRCRGTITGVWRSRAVSEEGGE